MIMMFDESSFLLDKLCIAAFKVDVDNNRVLVLSNSMRPIEVGFEFRWSNYTHTCLNGLFATNLSAWQKIQPEVLKQRLINSHYNQENLSFTIELLHSTQYSSSLYLQLTYLKEDNTNYFYITLKQDTEQSLLQSIVNTFVFNNSDYFIRVSLKDDYFTTISASENCLSLPPLEGQYSSELIKYAKIYVVHEDQDYVIEQMKIDNIIKRLSQQESFSIFFGLFENGIYKRKKLEFRYLDEKDKEIVLLSRSDITEAYNEERLKVRKLQDMLRRAYTDSLTGLLNRQGMLEQVQARLNSSKTNELFALLFIDLDNFKPINDNLGHPIGDRVLKDVAVVLKDELRASDDLTGRIGGDEFLVIVSHLKDKNHAKLVALRLIRRIEGIVPDENSHYRISASVGISFNNEVNDLQSLIDTADKRVYQAKSQGKGCVIDYD